MKKNEERSREMWEIIKCSKTHLLRWEYQNERTEKKQEKKIIEILTENFSSLMKNINLSSLLSRKREDNLQNRVLL